MKEQRRSRKPAGKLSVSNGVGGVKGFTSELLVKPLIYHEGRSEAEDKHREQSRLQKVNPSGGAKGLPNPASIRKRTKCLDPGQEGQGFFFHFAETIHTENSNRCPRARGKPNEASQEKPSEQKEGAPVIGGGWREKKDRRVKCFTKKASNSMKTNPGNRRLHPCGG